MINEQRPPAARAVDPGMPSSHATSLSFLATYTAAALALQPNAAPVHQALSAGVMLCAAFLVSRHCCRDVRDVFTEHNESTSSSTSLSPCTLLSLARTSMRLPTQRISEILVHASLQAWLRVHTGYHTALQTLAGFLLGSTAAAGWLAAYDSAVADWCRADPRHFSTIAALAAAAAAAFVFKMIGKPGK